MKPGEAEDILEVTNLILKEGFFKATIPNRSVTRYKLQLVYNKYGSYDVGHCCVETHFQNSKSAIRYLSKKIVWK